MSNPVYEIIIDEFGKEAIKKINDDNSIWWIPNDPSNSDYQEYLRSLEA